MSDMMRKCFLQLDRQVVDGSAYSAGTIWRSLLDEENVLFDDKVLLTLYDVSESQSSAGPGITAFLERHIVSEIDLEICELLIAVKEPGKRMEVYSDPNWLQEGRAIKMNSRVLITGGGNAKDSPMTGVVRFCGIITVGRQFGVELDLPFHGKGSSNGVFRRKKYFSCEEDCGLFVNIYRIRLVKERGLRTEQAQSPEEFGYEEHGTSLKLSMQYGEYPLRIGERVVWMSDDGPEFGTVKWIGHLPDTRTSEATVGLEFDNPIGSGTGRYKSQRLFTAKRNHASLVPLMGLMKLSDYLPDVAESSCGPGSTRFRSHSPGASGGNESQTSHMLTRTDMAYPRQRTNVAVDGDERNVESVAAQEMQKLDLRVRQAPVRGRVMPPSVAADAVDSLCGREKGLQGHSNSCGLEAVIFALFAFSSCFDDELYTEPSYESLRATIKKLLVEQIVNPLRATNYVSADRISRYNELISLIEKPDICTDGLESSSEAYEDPTDALKFILSDLLGINSLISTSSGHDEYVYRILEFDRTLVMEGMQHAVERVHLLSQYWIAEIPSHVLIIDVGERDYALSTGMIVPSPVINISDLLEGFPRQCKICGTHADLECSDCFAAESRSTQRDSTCLGDVSFCRECFGKFHQRSDRKLHTPIRLQSSLCTDVSSNERVKMELFAVISLVGGHYVSFVVSGSAVNSPWLFYDGMARRVVSDKRGAFVPEVRRCLEVSKCLEDFGVASYGSFSALPELVQQMIRGLRLCFYRRMKN